ncbi:MAG TPA: nucleotidyltransferase domain-containing protein [Bryobacteraceae bacterium]|nr:nucleotidyltransferase domain-containing protein [Bryobacteraceae bacterium]
MPGRTELESQIDEIVARIVQRFDPERIILFGSAARGEAGPDSDVDLLVVMRVDGRQREKAIEIGVAVNDVPVPKDIIVTTPENFEWRKNIPGTIERPAAREGRLLYVRR